MRQSRARFPEQALRDGYIAGTLRGAHGEWGPHLMDEDARGYVADMDRQRDRLELADLVRLAHEVARFYEKARLRGDGMLMTVL